MPRIGKLFQLRPSAVNHSKSGAKILPRKMAVKTELPTTKIGEKARVGTKSLSTRGARRKGFLKNPSEGRREAEKIRKLLNLKTSEDNIKRKKQRIEEKVLPI